MSDLPAAVAIVGEVPALVRSADKVGQIQILNRARSANDDLYLSLQSFVCNEQISRFRGNANSREAHALDTITAKLSFERGVEQYTSVFQNEHKRLSISSFPGIWSSGEFGTLLVQTQQLLARTKVVFQALDDLKGERTAIYQFDVSAEESPWDVDVGRNHYRVPFRTKVWISVNSGEIWKIARTSLGIDPKAHISQVQWCILLDQVSLNGKSWLLPSTGSYAVLFDKSERREWNLISFKDYKRYSAHSAVEFE